MDHRAPIRNNSNQYRQDSFHDYLHRNSDTLSDDIANLLSLMRKETNTPNTLIQCPRREEKLVMF